VPNPGKILCVGVNFRAHMKEMGREVPEHPVIFTRYPDTLVGGDCAIVRPRISAKFDYEGELGVIIGRPAKNVSVDDALDYSADQESLGKTVGDDFREGKITLPVLLAFEQVGGATRILEIRRDYSLQRKAFGRQIGSFQALKHKVADIYTANELARVHAYYGAWALSSNAPELPVAAAAARVAASVAFNRAAEEGIEIHGGIGFTWEMDCHLYMRRARHLAQLIGSEHTWRIRLADALIREAA